jgi:hypothetical protein
MGVSWYADPVLRHEKGWRRMTTPPDGFEPPPDGETVPETVKGGTDFNAPDLSEYPEAEATEDDTEYRDPLGEGDESSD